MYNSREREHQRKQKLFKCLKLKDFSNHGCFLDVVAHSLQIQSTVPLTVFPLHAVMLPSKWFHGEIIVDICKWRVI